MPNTKKNQQRVQADIEETDPVENVSTPPIDSLEAAALRIDELMQSEQEVVLPEVLPDEQELEQQAEDDDPVLQIEIDGEFHDVALSELQDAYMRSGDVEKETAQLKSRSEEIEKAFGQADEALARLIPTLQRQLMGDFAEVRSSADLRALAAADPMRFAEFQARQFALAQAEEQADALRNFEFERTRRREGEKLKSLIPELAEDESGAALHDEIRLYGQDQGFDDDRFAQAGADEVAILFKAMKYDQLKKGQDEAAKRAQEKKTAQAGVARVMTPGAARASEPNAGYRRAMAQLKKSGHVDDAARVIEMML